MTTGRPLQGPFADPIRKHLETARRQISQGQLKQAAQTLNQAQRILPGDARLFMLAALMAEKSGSQAGAFDAMRRCFSVLYYMPATTNFPKRSNWPKKWRSWSLITSRFWQE